jgi:NitT/TauT family transport system permease protein
LGGYQTTEYIASCIPAEPSDEPAVKEKRRNTEIVSGFIPFAACMIVILITLFIPDRIENENNVLFVGLLSGLGISLFFFRKKQSVRDIYTLVFALLGIWEVLTAKTTDHLSYLTPTPEMVLHTYVSDHAMILKGIGTTCTFLACGFIPGVLISVFLGILTGWSLRARKILLPIVKVLTPIPPLIYSPYLVVILPSFFAASVAIIFMSVFWCLYINMIFVIASMDPKLADMTRVMNVKPVTRFFRILIPYALPSILDRLPLALTAAFMVLFNAEMIGNAMSGMGYYIQFNARFAEYTKVVSGIILAGVFIAIMNSLFRRLKKAVINWQ